VRLVDRDGRTLLLIAVRLGDEKWVAFPLLYYANLRLVDVQDAYGYSALFIAIQNRNKSLIALL
jgi:ankyrin repeat protein